MKAIYYIPILCLVALASSAQYSEPGRHCSFSGEHYYYSDGRYGFSELRDYITDEPFDSKRLKIAKNYIRTGGVDAWQVAELMKLLTYESNKLELAKFSYHFTQDPENYFMVNRSFTYNSSADKLEDFIFGEDAD